MAHQVIDMKCPGCGAPTSTGETTCKYCHRPVIDNSDPDNGALAIFRPESIQISFGNYVLIGIVLRHYITSRLPVTYS